MRCKMQSFLPRRLAVLQKLLKMNASNERPKVRPAMQFPVSVIPPLRSVTWLFWMTSLGGGGLGIPPPVLKQGVRTMLLRSNHPQLSSASLSTHKL